MKRIHDLVLSFGGLIKNLETFWERFLCLGRKAVYVANNLCHVSFLIIHSVLYHELLSFGVALKNWQFILIL